MSAYFFEGYFKALFPAQPHHPQHRRHRTRPPAQRAPINNTCTCPHTGRVNSGAKGARVAIMVSGNGIIGVSSQVGLPT